MRRQYIASPIQIKLTCINGSSECVLSSEECSLEGVIINISWCVEFSILVASESTWLETERWDNQCTVLGTWWLLSTLETWRVLVAEVQTEGQKNVEDDITTKEDFPWGNLLCVEEWVLREPLCCDLVFLVHSLSQLEIKESCLVSCEMTGQCNLNCTTAITSCPFWMMILFTAESAYFLAERLSFLETSEWERFLQVWKIWSL